MTHTKDSVIIPRRSRPRALPILLALCLVLVCQPGAAENGNVFEQTAELKASALLSPELRNSALYTIDERVVNDGLLNQYTVRSSYGVFTVSSTRALKQLLAEIEAISLMKKVETKDTVTDAVVQSGKNTVTAVSNLVTDPQKTMEGAAAGVNSLFNRAKQTVGKKKTTAAEDSKVEQFIGKTKSKGMIASKYGVSVYSLNPVLQEELDRLAWADYLGGIGVGLAQSAIPGVGGLVLTASGTARLLNDVINTTPASELWVRNKNKLAAMGIHPDTVELFLNNPSFTPALQTIMVEALDVMDGVANRDLFIKISLQAHNHRMASIMNEMATMLAGYHKNVEPLKGVTPLGRVLSATTVKGNVVVAIPADHLLWTENVADAATWLTGATNESNPLANLQLWVLGNFSPKAQAELHALGWELHSDTQNTLFQTSH
ncbi:MAG TPA: hypothetical protein VK857_05325 [Desulforhopalus sp.]|nr:hypothetical protein [Desulforhopalus sp.]